MDKIPEKILSAAAKCPHQFACLKAGSGEAKEQCPVKCADGQDILFLSGNIDSVKGCPYRLSYGLGQVCRCPVHYHLHGRD